MQVKSLRVVLTGVLLSFGLAASMPVAQADPAGKGGMHGMHKGRPGQWMKDVKLTDDQRAKVEAIHKKTREDMASLRDAMRAKHDAVRDLMAGDGTPEKLRTAHAEIQDLRRKIDDLHFESMLSVRAVLTPEQRKKFAESMGPRGPMGMGGPGGPMGPEDDED